ncbi:SGNH/GDSL hydrolase family protein [Legionella fallonii]|uniref:Uncharacterized protein n=1 Tax=Legionella fallonii LLAP-10 TaxID=1212491 RepID=A0A098G0X0_9GAMM|nr:SGNH/GDSL hydrolase family protein [Legionella fallonii]CEG56118.1 conserved protein of unknown function [Legionella fallonii LLAP-10]
MKSVKNSSDSIGSGYPKTTGRLKKIVGTSNSAPTKVAFAGDSTLDNSAWIGSKGTLPHEKATVPHQTAIALAESKEKPDSSYDIANFAVDGATTADLMTDCPLNKVLPADSDHPNNTVHQLEAITQWGPDVVVLSVGGNNYREALMDTLQSQLNYPQLLLRITPESAKERIRTEFKKVKEQLLEDYKQIIDKLIDNNHQLKRIVLLSQYYPAITEFTPYFIYTGFSHIARAEGKGQNPFTAVEETMNELYREVLQYATTKNTEIVFADATSSLSPLGGNHALQIEPNEKGSKILGQLIANAVEYTFPDEDLESNERSIALLRMNADEKTVRSQLMQQSQLNDFKVKTVEQFIQENRYRHLGLLFSPSSRLNSRFEGAYHLIMGKQFDSEYTGLFAFGLLDLTLIPVLASYLWRVATKENVHTSLRITAGVVSAPILLSKMVVGLALMLVLALPILGYDQVTALFSTSEQSPTPTDEQEETINSDISPKV